MARWNSCNVLQVAPDANRLWQFGAKGGNFVLDREQKVPVSEPLPSRLVAKSWGSLWQPKLNVAWLPPESVFLRVIELPRSSFAETLSMVELQLEKLSPLPVVQTVWTIHVLPESVSAPPRHPVENAEEAPATPMQSVIVVIAARSAVEEFLGRLEKSGYQPDRLEAPMLDQLEAVTATNDGVAHQGQTSADAWIFAGMQGKDAALVAWRSGGALRSLGFVMLPPEGDRAKNLREQLTHFSWAGEMEGWLTDRPDWHLVADPVNAAEWETLFRAALDEPLKVSPPLPSAELAARTARRAAGAGPGAALLPPEFATRYHQQFVDRLWGRGLVAAGFMYAIGVVIYFCATYFLAQQTAKDTKLAAQLAGSYTNALEIKARYGVLKQRAALKYAALDCWNIAAQNLPRGLSLQRSSFADGQRFTVSGVCPPSEITEISDPGKFYDSVRKAKLDGQDVFEPAPVEPLIWSQNGNSVSWHFTLQLKNVEKLNL
jgi:hypothetical protein